MDESLDKEGQPLMTCAYKYQARTGPLQRIPAGYCRRELLTKKVLNLRGTSKGDEGAPADFLKLCCWTVGLELDAVISKVCDRLLAIGWLDKLIWQFATDMVQPRSAMLTCQVSEAYLVEQSLSSTGKKRHTLFSMLIMRPMT